MVFDFQNHIVHHMQNSYYWQLPFLPPVALPAPLTLHALMVIFAFFFLLILFCFFYKKNLPVPTGITNLLEAVVVFVRDDIAITSLGEKDGRRMTPLFCTFFFFILTLNVLGLIPLFATATSNVNVTGALAMVTFSFMVFGAIYKNGFKAFLRVLVPSGVPFPVLFLVVPLEFMGLFIRTFALMIRLFANMLGGHITIAVLIGLGVLFFGVITVPVVALVLMIYLIEVLIAFIQAYVFTLLSAMIIGQTYHPDH
ncbi:MAG: F0F1 ATP synthase subunit A [Candidatus Omnitrophica bacterium]|nr:F0F1 ATP synthase subunit A [Candidatus Omnitrophota bacterium]